jgi:hypothetical protein
MIENKRQMVATMLKLKADLEIYINETICENIKEFINKIYDDQNYTIFDKQIIEYIISNILNKSVINDNEKNILKLIIKKIQDTCNFRNDGPYKSTLIKIIDKVCLLHNNYNNKNAIKKKIKNIMTNMAKSEVMRNCILKS